jgi:hypothetical protein
MADQPTEPNEALIDGYLDGTLTATQHAELFRRLETDRALLKRFAQLTELDAICREHAGHALEAELLRNQMLPLAQDPNGPAQAENLLQELADFEAGLEDSVPLVDITDQLKQKRLEEKRAKDHRLRLSPRQVNAKDLVIPKWVVYGGIAAVLTICAMIFWPSKPEPTVPSIADKNNPIQQPAPVPDPIVPTLVATLTDTHDARWAEGLIMTGSQLRAGQRLTLTAGFAEITTHRGAIAIIEAPATIELIDHNNAIRLSSGKLVGICETPSSKGFLVRTPRLDITDLGTRFGVDATKAQQTDVHVFDGLVEVRSGASVNEEGTSLAAGQAARFIGAAQALTIEPDINAFAMSVDSASTYAEAVLKDRPLIFWRCEKLVEGLVINDADANAFNAEVRGPLKLGTGLFGGAALLNGDASTQSGLVSDKPVLAEGVTDSYTFEAWVKPDRIHRGTIATLYSDVQGLKEPVAAHIDMRPIVTEDLELVADRIIFRYSRLVSSSDGALANVLIKEEVAYQPNQWIHVVAVNEPGKAKLYLNGKLIQQAEYEKSQGDSQLKAPRYLSVANTGIGIQENQSNFRTFSGLVDEIAFYGHALSQEQIEQHYKLGLPQQQ